MENYRDADCFKICTMDPKDDVVDMFSSLSCQTSLSMRDQESKNSIKSRLDPVEMARLFHSIDICFKVEQYLYELTNFLAKGQRKEDKKLLYQMNDEKKSSGKSKVNYSQSRTTASLSKTEKNSTFPKTIKEADEFYSRMQSFMS
jgi:hypothetical protein